ncbi:MAG: DUF3102 domain-containing protein [Leptospiraceae bacterium]|nr:DUF3102 domain-containing protein [Leptospiraceae bacterium]
MIKKKKKPSRSKPELVPFIPSRVSKDKDEIVKEIETLHLKFLENARNHLLLAKKIGGILERKKSEVKHGEWEDWVEENLSFSIRTVQYYMKINKYWDSLINTPTKSVGMLTEAIELITEKRSLDAEAVSEKLRQEKRVEHKDIISLHRRFFKKGESLNKNEKKALFRFLDDVRFKRETKFQKYQEGIEKIKEAIQENKKQIKKVLDSMKD